MTIKSFGEYLEPVIETNGQLERRIELERADAARVAVEQVCTTLESLAVGSAYHQARRKFLGAIRSMKVQLHKPDTDCA